MNIEATGSEKCHYPSISRTQRRFWVSLNAAALLAFLVCVYLAGDRGPRLIPAAVGCASLVVLLISFAQALWKTRLWHLTHTPVDKLDERQLLITHDALRRSYTVFTILSLSILLIHTLLSLRSVFFNQLSLMPVIAAFIYLAHTLPAGFLAWKEKEI